MGQIISGDRSLSTEALNDRAARAASGLRELGIGLNDAIALVLRNDFAFLEATYAAGLVGAYAVPVNWHSTAYEARYVFEDSAAKLVVVHADLLPAIESALPKGVPVIVVRTPMEIATAYRIPVDRCAVPEGHVDWDQWVEQHAPKPAEAIEPPNTMIYTSGTTGRPKGVRRDPPTAAQNAASRARLMRGFGWDKGDPSKIVTVITGPMYHSAPNAYGVIGGRLGGTVVLQPKFDAEELLEMIERHGVTHLQMVPIMFNRLLKLPEDIRRRYDLSSLQFMVHAAAPVAPMIKREMIAWLGATIREYYGTTETGMLTECSAEDWLAHPGTVGRAIDGVVIRILDKDGNEAAIGTPGEIAGLAADIADFTYHNDAKKRLSAARHGLFLTGDIGFLDRDGFLYLCDRSKDIIIAGGVNIYPAEIEGELHKMPGLVDCAVFGIPDDEFGEAICAIVEVESGAALNPADVSNFLRDRIAGYKIPKRIEFRRDLPREDSGKIFKRKLRDEFWEGQGRQI